MAAHQENPKDRLSFVLAVQILELVQSAAPNRTEAECAVNMALAMLPDLDLKVKPTAVWR